METAPQLPLPLLAAWVGFVGAAIGSFLNVVIARLPDPKLSIVSPASRCPRCRTPIRWYDNVPIVSWIVLRARCRACRAPISIRYPVVEAVTAGLALLAFHRHGLSLAALAEFAFAAILLALAAIDLDRWLLPYRLTLPLIALGLGAAAAGAGAAPSLASSAAGAAVGWGAFWLVGFVGSRVAGRDALGEGDVWLLAGLGAWLGAGALLPVVLLASTQGAVVGIGLILLGRAQPGPPEPPAGAAAAAGDEDDWVPPRNSVPFGPFLALGALEWLYLGPLLAAWIPVFEPFL